MKRNRIGGQWSPRLIEMLESPAYRVLSVSAHRVISRIEIEHASHGGSENGNLPVTKHSRAYPPTHEWRKIKTIEEAQAIADAARAAKDPRAVRFAQNRAAQKTKNRGGKPPPKPGVKTTTENASSPVVETTTAGQGRKPPPLSISRGGGRGCGRCL